MMIHFSVLAVILVCALIWERPIRYHKLNSIYYGERYDYKSPLMPWLIVFGYIAYLAAMRSGMNDTSGYIQSFEHIPGTWDDVSRILDGDGKDKAFDITANIFKMYVSDDYHGWFGLFAAVESCIFIHVLRRESVSFLDSCFVPCRLSGGCDTRYARSVFSTHTPQGGISCRFAAIHLLSP